MKTFISTTLSLLFLIHSHAFSSYFIPSEMNNSFQPAYVAPSANNLGVFTSHNTNFLAPIPYYSTPLHSLMHTYTSDLMWHLDSKSLYNNSDYFILNNSQNLGTVDCTPYVSNYDYYNYLLDYIEMRYEKNNAYIDYYTDDGMNKKFEPAVSNIAQFKDEEEESKKRKAKEKEKEKKSDPPYTVKISEKEKKEPKIVKKTIEQSKGKEKREPSNIDLIKNEENTSLTKKTERTRDKKSDKRFLVSKKIEPIITFEETYSKSSEKSSEKSYTISHKTPKKGLKKKKSVKLLPGKGPGYICYSDPKKRYGESETLRVIAEVGKELEKENLIHAVGNISKKFGGRLPPHASHTNGRDVDIGLMPKTGKALGELDINDPNYSRQRTIALIDKYIQKGNIETIFFDDKEVLEEINRKYGKEIVVSDSEYPHSDHIHVRFAENEGSNT